MNIDQVIKKISKKTLAVFLTHAQGFNGLNKKLLRILKRNQNDFKATLELDSYLKKINPNDPVKYDFALFGLGVFENF